MNIHSYIWMKEGVYYDAYYRLGGKCKIKKAAEDVKDGMVQTKLPNGDVIQRRFDFFDLLLESDEQSF